MSWKNWFAPATAPASEPKPRTSTVAVDKRALRIERMLAHIEKLERKNTPEALRKAAEHRRELAALELEERAAELRSGVVIRPGPASMGLSDGGR